MRTTGRTKFAFCRARDILKTEFARSDVPIVRVVKIIEGEFKGLAFSTLCSSVRKAARDLGRDVYRSADDGDEWIAMPGSTTSRVLHGERRPNAAEEWT